MKRILCLLLAVAIAIPASTAFAGPKKKGDKPKRSPDAVFKKLDKNGDGKLTKEEIPAGKKGNADKRFKQLDKNNDGSVSLDEFKSRGKKGDAPKKKKK